MPPASPPATLSFLTHPCPTPTPPSPPSLPELPLVQVDPYTLISALMYKGSEGSTVGEWAQRFGVPLVEESDAERSMFDVKPEFLENILVLTVRKLFPGVDIKDVGASTFENALSEYNPYAQGGSRDGSPAPDASEDRSRGGSPAPDASEDRAASPAPSAASSNAIGVEEESVVSEYEPARGSAGYKGVMTAQEKKMHEEQVDRERVEMVHRSSDVLAGLGNVIIPKLAIYTEGGAEVGQGPPTYSLVCPACLVTPSAPYLGPKADAVPHVFCFKAMGTEYDMSSCMGICEYVFVCVPPLPRPLLYCVLCPS